MFRLSKILVVIEPEQDDQLALDKAIRLARVSGASLELVICDHNAYLDDGFYFDPPQARLLRQEHVERNRLLLEDMAKVIRQQGFAVTVDALWGNPSYQKLIEKVLSSKPDLLIQSTRHHEKIARLLLSHQDWQLLRYCPCPLLLVKDLAWPEHPLLVAAVDPVHSNDKPADLDHQLTDVAHSLAKLTGGDVRLFHSCYQAPVSGVYPLVVDKALYREKTAGLLAAFSLPEDALCISDEIVTQALPAYLKQQQASVLVMGAVSRSALDRFFVGSTAEKLLDRVDQDVLVVKPAGFTDTVKKARPENL
ncbi:universal stress protein [Pseudohongiella sp.]|uniref:UspA domain-containing protein n=1 Tax=marine sediment metagenome TaxID=412755 RepID=A0A0F9Z5J2_9ZZZZ|nr:universal stress protein [Pseudohongiella sp.]